MFRIIAINSNSPCKRKNVPCHEIMVLFVLHKLIPQTCMRSHLVGLDVWFLVRLFVFFHTSYERTAKALARLRACAGSPDPSLVAYMTSTIISWAGLNVPCDKTRHLSGVWFEILQTHIHSHSYGKRCGCLSEASSSPLYCMSKQWRLWQDCVDASSLVFKQLPWDLANENACKIPRLQWIDSVYTLHAYLLSYMYT